jgi:hypothetical protein
MPGMQSKFDAELQAAFEIAAAGRAKIEDFKKLTKQDPAATAAAVFKLIPQLMERYQTQARESFGVDIANEGWKEQFKQKRRSDAEALHLLEVANRYLVFSWCRTKLDAYAADTSLSNEEWAAKVCEVGVEALRGMEAASQHSLQELLGRSSGEAARFVKDVLGRELAGQLATRISVERYGRLRRALDDIREHNKPARRARFEALLRELYTLGPESWANHHVTDWQLEVTRSAAVKAIEQRRRPPTEVEELAAFADREALLKTGRELGLPPREYELFRLVFSEPERFLRNGKLNHAEAAREMRVATGTVKSLWARIRKTLAA